MRFVEGATLLRALITSESSDDIEMLVERAEEIRLSLHHRARGTPHHVILVTAACNQVVEFLTQRKNSHPACGEENLLRLLDSLEEADE
jgi:hypothetical protein